MCIRKYIAPKITKRRHWMTRGRSVFSSIGWFGLIQVEHSPNVSLGVQCLSLGVHVYLSQHLTMVRVFMCGLIHVYAWFSLNISQKKHWSQNSSLKQLHSTKEHKIAALGHLCDMFEKKKKNQSARRYIMVTGK